MWTRIAWSVVALVLIAVLVWTGSRMLGASAAERQALALMEEAWQPQGRNAFADLWLAEFPVPAEQRDAVLAEDVARFATTSPPAQADGTDSTAGFAQVQTWPAFESAAGERWPSDGLDQGQRGVLCSAGEDCLAKVRADMTTYTALLQTHQARFERFAQATAGDYVRNPFPLRMDTPWPPYQGLYAPATLYATGFAIGQREQALQGVCARIVDWRRLQAHNDSLIGAMLGASLVGRGYAPLAAAMLAELPADAPLPPVCAQAFAAADSDEATLCQAMRGEFNMVRMISAEAMQQARDEGGTGLSARLFFEPGMAAAGTAYNMAAYCAPSNRRFAVDDVAIELPKPQGSLRLQCVANAIGCVLNDIAAPAYASYGDRIRDQFALQRLMAGMLWLHTQPQLLAQPERIPAELPSQYQSAGRALAFDAQRRAIVLPLRDTQRPDEREWVVPLPASRVQ